VAEIVHERDNSKKLNMSLDEERAENYLGLAQVYERLGDLDHAITILKQGEKKCIYRRGQLLDRIYEIENELTIQLTSKVPNLGRGASWKCDDFDGDGKYELFYESSVDEKMEVWNAYFCNSSAWELAPTANSVRTRYVTHHFCG